MCVIAGEWWAVTCPRCWSGTVRHQRGDSQCSAASWTSSAAWRQKTAWTTTQVGHSAIALNWLYLFVSLSVWPTTRAGLTIRGPHTNITWGPFSRMRSQDFFLSEGALFFPPPPKVDDLFSRFNLHETCGFWTFKQRGKNFAVDRGGPWRRGPPPMVQPAQWLIRPCLPPAPVMECEIDQGKCVLACGVLPSIMCWTRNNT